MRFFVLLCVFFGGLGQGVVNPKLPEILSDHSRLALDSGISASLMYLGIFLASFLYGKWCDRGQVFRLLSAGLFFYALVLFFFSRTENRDAIFILRFFEGLTLSAIFVSADFVLCRASSSADRGQWLSFYGVALSIGLLFGPAIILLLDFLHILKSLYVSLMSVAVCSFFLALASFRFELPKIEYVVLGLLKEKQAALSATLYGFFESGLVATLAAITVKSAALRVEYVFILVIVSAALASIYWGHRIDKVGGKKTLSQVFAFLSFGIFLVLLAPLLSISSPRLLAAAIIFGIAAGGIYPAGFAWLIEGSDPSQYGYASGLFTRAYGLGSLFGPLCFGLLIEARGENGLYFLSCLLGILGVLVTRYRFFTLKI